MWADSDTMYGGVSDRIRVTSSGHTGHVRLPNLADPGYGIIVLSDGYDE